jgi:hypothetical protein
LKNAAISSSLMPPAWIRWPKSSGLSFPAVSTLPWWENLFPLAFLA